MIYKNLPADSVTAVHKLCNFLMLLRIIGDIKWEVRRHDDTYSMSLLSYDPDKRKTSQIHQFKALEREIARLKGKGWF